LLLEETMTDGFTRRKEQSKEEIRKAAWELFGQFGVEKVSIVDIARKAGVSQATIYNNFGSKDALAKEFVTSAIDHLVDSIQEVLAPEKPYWEKMADFIGYLSEMMAQGKTAQADAAAFSSSYDLLNDPEIKKFRDAAREKMTGLLLKLVQEGKAQGHIRPDLSEDAFRFYFAAFSEIFITPQFRQGYYREPKLLHELCSLMIHGMSGGKQ
jgi:AcrR family transcriptional regulator